MSERDSGKRRNDDASSAQSKRPKTDAPKEAHTDAPKAPKETRTDAPKAPKLAFDMPRKPVVPGSIKIGVGKPASKIAFGAFKMGVQKSSSQEKLSKQTGSAKQPGAEGLKVAAAFAEDSDDEEEMPAEARMRMRNIGRETPTSAGPNSFGKGRMGFQNHKKLYEKLLDEVAE